MKFALSLTLITACASHFGTNAVFAQKRAKPKEVIVVYFPMPNGESPSKWKIPIYKSPRGKFNGGGMVSECGFPDNPECAKFIYASYEYQAKAFALRKNRVRIDLKIDFAVGANECKTRRLFTVYRNRQTKIRLGCGTTLTARYGLSTEKAN
jgi:hypothetical protein